jgi:hypothetical protein
MAALSSPESFLEKKTVMSRAFGVRFDAFIAVSVITIGIFVFSVVSAAEPELITASGFDHVGFSFSDGRNTFLQVRDHGLEVLWDPISKVEAPASTGLLSKLTRFTDLLSPSQVDSIPKENQRDVDVTAFSAHHWEDGSFIVMYYDPRITRLSWDSFYEIFLRGRSLGKFYIVNDQSSGNYKISRYVRRPNGGDEPILTETLTQRIGSEGLTSVNRLPDDTFLLNVIQFSQFPCKSACDYVISLRSAPSSALSFDGHVFLIPYQAMQTALNAAGPTLLARYDAVQNLIKRASPMPVANAFRRVTINQLLSKHEEQSK